MEANQAIVLTMTKNFMRGMIAVGAIISGANPILIRGPRARAAPARCLPARSRVPADRKSGGQGSDGGALATTHEAGVRRPDVRAAVRFGEVAKQKARGGLLRAGGSNFSRSNFSL